jgi:hypothetical protein
MEKSNEIEAVADRITSALQDLTIFPKMYHPTEDQINLGLIVDGKRVIIEIKTTKSK